MANKKRLLLLLSSLALGLGALGAGVGVSYALYSRTVEIKNGNDLVNVGTLGERDTYYLSCSDWDYDSAQIWAMFMVKANAEADSSKSLWMKGTAYGNSGYDYYFSIPGDSDYNYVLFARAHNTRVDYAHQPDFETANSVWNQTDDLVLSGNKGRVYTITAINTPPTKSSGAWGDLS